MQSSMPGEGPVRTHWMDRVQAVLSRINVGGSLVSGFGFLIIMLVTMYEVIMRYLFRAPTMWTLEASRYLMLVAVFFAAAYTLEMGGHIRVDLLVGRLPLGKRHIVNIVSSTLGVFFCVMLVWISGALAWLYYDLNVKSMTILAVPLFPIYVFVPIGSLFLLVQALLNFFRLLGEGRRV